MSFLFDFHKMWVIRKSVDVRVASSNEVFSLLSSSLLLFCFSCWLFWLTVFVVLFDWIDNARICCCRGSCSCSVLHCREHHLWLPEGVCTTLNQYHIEETVPCFTTRSFMRFQWVGHLCVQDCVCSGWDAWGCGEHALLVPCAQRHDLCSWRHCSDRGGQGELPGVCRFFPILSHSILTQELHCS